MEVVDPLFSVAAMSAPAVLAKVRAEVRLVAMGEGEPDRANLGSERQFPGPIENRRPASELPTASILTAMSKEWALALKVESALA